MNIIILRAGLVESGSDYYVPKPSSKKSTKLSTTPKLTPNKTTLKIGSTPTSNTTPKIGSTPKTTPKIGSTPTSNTTPAPSEPLRSSNTTNNDTMVVDKCAESGEIGFCTQQNPYCFVDGDDLHCGSTDRVGWRISPLDGLTLVNGRRPNGTCELFNPPKQPKIQSIVMNLLNQSEFGSMYEGHESAWFNTFDYLGNCPSKSQFCDKDLLVCKGLFGAGATCNSSNQCFSRLCQKYDENAPEDTTERLCVENNITEEFLKRTSNRDVIITFIILLNIGFAMLILVLVIFLTKARTKKPKLPSIDPLLSPTRHLSALQPNPIPGNTTDNRNTISSDGFSILLPPPPTISRDGDLRYNPNRYDSNVDASQDSIDIDPSPIST